MTAGGTVDGFSAGLVFDFASGETDTIVGVERVVGTAQNDTFTVGGTVISDFTDYVEFEGGAGNDQIIGNGNTRVAYSNATGSVHVDLFEFSFFGIPIIEAFAQGDLSVGRDSLSSVNQASGSAFADTLLGGTGDDTLQGEAGDDTLDGRGGVDTADYWSSGNGVTVDLSLNLTLDDGFGDQDTLTSIESVRGSEFADSLAGDGNANRLTGGGGDDTLSGEDGADNLDGGEGADTIFGGGGQDSLSGGEGSDTLRGGSGSDQLVGGGGADHLLGGNDNDTLNGATGDDTLDGGSGFDSLFGGDGDDTLFAGAGNDSLNGGDGFDILDASASILGQSVFIASGFAFGSETGVDRFTGIEHVIVGAGADVVIGGNADDRIDLGGGNDFGSGGAGSDTLFGGDGADDLNGGLGSDFLGGDSGNDVLRGDSGNDTLDGGAGSDSIAGGAGTDILVEQDGSGDDTYAGGADNDTLDYGAVTGDVAVDLLQGTATGAGIGNDTLTAIENIQGGAGNDAITGDDSANTLTGGGGNDSLAGGLGDDVFTGAEDSGDDTYAGGEGIDTVDFTGVSDVVAADLAAGTVTVAGLGTDALLDIERLVGGAADDTLTGGGGADTLDGGQGADILDGGDENDVLLGNDGDDTLKGSAGDDIFVGGAGFDTLDYSAQTQAVIVTASSGDASGDGIGNDIFGEIERFLGGSGNDGIAGGGDDDVIETGGGNDVGLGGAGNDTILGGDGVDSLSGNADDDFLDGGNDADLLFGGGGNDTLLGSGGNDELIGDAGDDTLDGGVGDDLHFGGAGDDIFVGTEDGDDDEFFGGDDPDDASSTAVGTLSGSDTVDYSTVATTITVNLGGNFAIGGGIGIDALVDIDTVIGGLADDTMTGSTGANTLSGGGGNDTLSGGDGEDRFLASLDTGDDTIDGGSGLDTLDYTGVAASVTIDATAGTAVAAGIGADSIESIENFIGGDGDDTITGSAAEEILQGGDGADFLSGGGAADTISGGAGDDTLDGGAGDDSLFGGSGIDAVDYSGATLDVSVDLLGGTVSLLEDDDGTVTVTETDALTAIEHAITGAGNDSLTGSGADEIFDGGAGIDTVFAGGGGDRVVVAADGEVDSYAGGAGVDILDFTQLSVGLVADLATQTADTSVGTFLAGDAFTGFEGIIGGGDDTITGTAGDDTLVGGGGDDTLRGIGGTDRIDGGDGNDLIVAGGGIGEDVFDGGAGFDILDLSDVAVSVVLDLAEGTAEAAIGGEAVAREIVNIERILAGSGGDTIFGSSGADDIDGGAGSDSVFARGGDDRVVFDAADATIDGGAGVDTLAVAGAAQTLDDTALANTGRIEAVDLSGDGSNTFVATAELILGKSDTGTLSVEGDGDDVLRTEGDWTAVGAPGVLVAANTAELRVAVETLVNTGSIDFADGASLDVGTFNNQATLRVEGVAATVGGQIENDAGAAITLDSSAIDASLTIANGLTNEGQVTLTGGTGSLDIQGGVLSNAATLAVASGTQFVDGSLDNIAGGTISVAAPASFVFGSDGGATDTLSNSGAIVVDGAMRLVDATLQHGGDLTLGSGATLEIGNGATVDFQTDFTLLADRTMLVGDGVSGAIEGTAVVTNQGEIVLDNGVIGGSLVNQGALSLSVGDNSYFVDGELTLAGGSIDLDGSKTLSTLNGNGRVVNQGDLILQNDTIDVDFVHEAGTLQLSTNLDITGALTLVGTAVVNTVAGVVIAGTGALDNSGTITVSGATLNSDNVVNRKLMSFEGVAGIVTSDTVTNTGTGTMAFSTDVDFDLDAGQTFDNQGLLDIDSGTLTFSDGLLAHSGDLDIASGAELAIDGGTLSMQAGGTLTGDGVVSFSSALEIAIGVAFTNSTGIPSLSFENGDLIGAGSFVNQALFSMAGGTIGVANFTNDVGGVLQAENGSIEFAGGASVFTSLAGATLSILSDTADAAIVLPSGFSNAGLISFAGAAANTGTLDLGTDTLANQSGGEIALASGVHEIAGAVDNQSGATLSVTTDGADGARLSVSGGMDNAGTIALNATGGLGGSGTLDVTGATLTNNAAGSILFDGTGTLDTLAIAGDIDNQGTIVVTSAADNQIGSAGGAIANLGTLDIATGSSLTIGEAAGVIGSFDNSGTVSLDGDLLLRNTLFSQDTGDIEFGGGTFVLSDGGTLEIASDFTLGALGTLALDSGGSITAENGSSATLDNQGAIVFNGGAFDIDTENSGTLSTAGSNFDISGSLSNVGDGTLGLDGTKTLTGGGTIEFLNDLDLTDDTVGTATTVSISDTAPPSDPVLTVSNTTVDGVLIANSGASVTFAGSLLGDGTFLHDAEGSTLNQAISVANFENTGTLTLSGGSLTSANATNADLLSVASNSVIDPGTGGTFTNSDTVQIGDGIALTFGDGVLLNTDLIDLSTSGTLAISGGTLQNNGSLDLDADTKILVDSGTLAGTDTLTIAGTLSLENGGALAQTAVNEGTLTTSGDSYNLQGVLSTTDAGTIVLSNSKTLTGGGTLEFLTDLDLTEDTVGALTTVLVSDTAPPTDPVLTISGTTIDGVLHATDSSLVTFGGSLTGGGTFLHDANGSTLSTVIDVATLENNGELALTGGTLASATATNSGLLAIETDSLIDPGADGAFNNSGTIQIENSATMIFGDAIDGGLLTNTSGGTLDVLAGGTLSVAGGIIQNDGALALAGVLEVGVGSVFQQNVDLTLDAAASIDLSTGGTLLVAGGALGLDTGASIAADAGTATVELDGGSILLLSDFALDSDLTVAASGTQTNLLSLDTFTFTNAGTVDVASGATLDVTAALGGAFENQGTFDTAADVSLGGAFANQGVLAIAGATFTASEMTLASGGTVTLDGSGAAASLTDSGGELLNSGLVTITAGTASLDSDTISNAGTIAVENGATLQQSAGGTLSNTGDIEIALGAAVEVGTSTGASAAFDNSGTVAVDGGLLLRNTIISHNAGALDVFGSLDLTEGSTLTLDTVATVTASGTLGLGDGAGAAERIDGSSGLVNQGTVVFEGGTFASGSLGNSGVLDVAASSLLDPTSGGIVTNSGTVAIQDDVVLTFGDGTLDGLFSNTGTIDTSSSGTLTIAGGTLQVDGGSIAGSGALLNQSDVVITAAGTIGGTFVNSGRLSIDGVAVTVAGIDLASSGTLTLDGGAGDASLTETGTVLLNSGLITVTGGNGSLGAATISNLSGATIAVESGATLQQGGTLLNAGDLSLSGKLEMVGAAVVNSETLTVDGGTLTGADVSNSGLLDVTAASVVDLDTGGSVTNSGTLAIQDGVTLNFADGVLRNSGTIDFGDGVSITTTSGSIENSGLIEIGTVTGVASIDTDLSLDIASTLQIDLDSSTVTPFDQLIVNGALDLGGTLSVSETGSFSVGLNDSFHIIDTGAATPTGDFDFVEGLETGDGFVLDLSQGSGGVTLTSVAVDFQGTASGDTLTGLTLDQEVFVGEGGDDTLASFGGTDLLHGGAGDDLFILPDLSFGRLDGGDGLDRVVFEGDNPGSFNLIPLRGDQLSNIERIDISGTATVSLTLDVDTVLSATGGTNTLTGNDNSLIIDGDAGDTLTATGGWAADGSTTIDSTSYSIFNDTDTGAEILVNSAIAASVS